MVEKSSRVADDKNMQRRTEKMFGLLAIAITLCPCRIDETIMTKLNEKHADRMLKMSQVRGCPHSPSAFALFLLRVTCCPLPCHCGAFVAACSLIAAVPAG